MRCCYRPLIVLTTLAAAFTTAARAADTLYVDADAARAGDGSSWASAYADLQAAFDDAQTLNTDSDPANDIDTIRIMGDQTFTPHSSDRSVSFTLPDNVAVLGAHTGNGDERNVTDESYFTRLSAELQNDGDPTNNTYRVMNLGDFLFGIDPVSGLSLDGLVIEGGYANGQSNDQLGGGGGGGHLRKWLIHVA